MQLLNVVTYSVSDVNLGFQQLEIVKLMIVVFVYMSKLQFN